ncbi:MAG: dihydrolipoyllysine-residue acetyltransferase [Paludibacter sp.]|jgi:pyruvate dehydrogenase E2 component (dihydrolipoamide acetyltransferase)|nr:dihydrolipoyllysine-residue acetyltransferase [Paludibacter sp.]
MRNFVIPELGENINSATVVKVLVKAGDMVEADQPLLELETDKATIEVPADAAGTVAEIKVNEGEQVSIGQLVLVFAGESAATPGPAKEEAPAPAQPLATPQPAPAPQAAPVATAGTGTLEFTLPELGENIRTATIVKVLIAVGDTVENDQAVLEVETDKATIEVPSSIAGKVTEVLVAEGDATPIGAVIFRVSGSVAAPAATPAAQPAAVQTAAPVVAEAKTEFVPEVTKPAEAPKVIALENQPPILQNAAPAAPSVRRLAREIGVDVNQVKGSGPGGRILLDDVKAYSKLLHQQRNEVQHIRAEQHQQPLPDFTKFGNVERQAMSNIRFKTAEHLSHAWHTIPHVTQFDKADITALEEFRKSYAKTAEKEGVKLTVTAILVKIIASALKKFPQFNSSVDMMTKEIIYKHYFNIGIAVDTDFGLIVPVIKNADQLNVIEISKEMNALAEKARNKKTSIADMQGGCFTITNLGGIGGTAFTPIVNAPEVAILGVSRGSIEPVYINGKFEPRMMLPLSLSYDHRVIDGADGIRFLRWIIDAIENPMKFVIEG